MRSWKALFQLLMMVILSSCWLILICPKRLQSIVTITLNMSGKADEHQMVNTPVRYLWDETRTS